MTTNLISSLNQNINTNNQMINFLVNDNKTQQKSLLNAQSLLTRTKDNKQKSQLKSQSQVLNTKIANNNTLIRQLQNNLIKQKQHLSMVVKEKYTALHAPRPNLGSCSQTGKWPNQAMIADCVTCLSSPDWYGSKQFYCDGKCESEYNTNQVCSMGSLVAKTIGQCSAPCKQAKPPSLLNSACTDNFDCDNGQICSISNGSGACIDAPQTLAPTLAPTIAPTIAPTNTTPAPVISEGYYYTKENIIDYSKIPYLAGFYDQKTQLYMGVI